jgi:hypothetical protein
MSSVAGVGMEPSVATQLSDCGSVSGDLPLSTRIPASSGQGTNTPEHSSRDARRLSNEVEGMNELGGTDGHGGGWLFRHPARAMRLAGEKAGPFSGPRR